MYKFYCDDTLFYVSGVDDSDFYILSAKLSLERGKTGALTFAIPHTNIIYDRIQKLKSIITVYDGDEEIFRGRVLYDEKDFYNRKTITCEGELAFLLDTIQRPYEHKGSLNDFFSHLVENHNSQVESNKRFKVGEITVTDNNDYLSRSSAEYDNTYNVINEKLIKAYGGYLRVRVQDGERYIDYVEEFGGINDQVIEFGTNLLDIKEYITAEDVFTCLIPLGQKNSETNERVTIESVNGGVDYLMNTTGIGLFGKIWAYNTWDDVTEPTNLKRKGEELLNANIEMSVTLTLKAVDLHLLNINTKRIKQGDKLRVVSLPHKLDKYFECTKIDIDILNSSNNEYTFGSTYKTLTTPSEGLDDKTIVFVEEAIKGVTEETKQEIADIKESLTQEQLMNIITNNGEAEGVYLVDGQLWINGTYIKVNKLSAISANLGDITAGSINIGEGNFIVTSDGKLTAKAGDFDGKITASDGGTIGGFTINEKSLDANDRIKLDSQGQIHVVGGSGSYIGSDTRYYPLAQLSGGSIQIGGVTECAIADIERDNYHYAYYHNASIMLFEKGETLCWFSVDTMNKALSMTDGKIYAKEIYADKLNSVTKDELNYLSGATSNIQEQIDNLSLLWTEEDKEEILNEILNKIIAREKTPKIGVVNLTASKWNGTGNLYSQVVSIAGVTENSQVDLTPSVEQLAVFYEKDLAFVTENEGGIVTVYAIGQKPQNDYTIQVTITEVEYG